MFLSFWALNFYDNFYPRLDKLLHILDNFEVNQTYFNKNKIPEQFYTQVFTFIVKSSNNEVFKKIRDRLTKYKMDLMMIDWG